MEMLDKEACRKEENDIQWLVDNELHGCQTGDCYHNSRAECIEELAPYLCPALPEVVVEAGAIDIRKFPLLPSVAGQSLNATTEHVQLPPKIEPVVLPEGADSSHGERGARIATGAQENGAARMEGAVEESGDTRDQWSDSIDSAHPTLTGKHKSYEMAQEMVSNRHSKGALVDLVNWLLTYRGIKPEEGADRLLTEAELSDTDPEGDAYANGYADGYKAKAIANEQAITEGAVEAARFAMHHVDCPHKAALSVRDIELLAQAALSAGVPALMAEVERLKAEAGKAEREYGCGCCGYIDLDSGNCPECRGAKKVCTDTATCITCGGTGSVQALTPAKTGEVS